jgi:hypothetical protein
MTVGMALLSVQLLLQVLAGHPRRNDIIASTEP